MCPKTNEIEQQLHDVLNSCATTASDQLSNVIFPPLCVYVCVLPHVCRHLQAHVCFYVVNCLW